MGMNKDLENPGICENCGQFQDFEENDCCAKCGGEIKETYEEKCPKCEETHYHRPHNECACCLERSVVIGIHFPVLCYDCSLALGKIRQELHPCPNCGKTAGSQIQEEKGYRCNNSNCRVNYYSSEEGKKIYERIKERRGLV